MQKTFSIGDIQKERGITMASAKVFCVRKKKKGEFIRIKRGTYMTENDFQNLSLDELFLMANFLQTPSYISLLTALSYYQITTQILPDTIESIAIKRTGRSRIREKTFEFFKIKKSFFSDFRKEKIFFIATPEKAFLDCIYLMSIGKYSIDFGSIDFIKLSKNRLKKTIKKYPKRTQKLFQQLKFS